MIELNDEEKKLIDSNEEILKPLAQGKSIKEVAHIHGEKPNTLTKRAERIRIKLGCTNLVHLISVCTQYWNGRNVTSDTNGMIGG